MVLWLSGALAAGLCLSLPFTPFHVLLLCHIDAYGTVYTANVICASGLDSIRVQLYIVDPTKTYRYTTLDKSKVESLFCEYC